MRHVGSEAAENLDDFRFRTPVVAERAPFFRGACQHQNSSTQVMSGIKIVYGKHRVKAP